MHISAKRKLSVYMDNLRLKVPTNTWWGLALNTWSKLWIISIVSDIWTNMHYYYTCVCDNQLELLSSVKFNIKEAKGEPGKDESSLKLHLLAQKKKAKYYYAIFL